jgi:molecular chaperone DnaK
MVQDADRHRDEDARLREMIDARNALDSAAYQVERRLAELGDAVPVHEKGRAEMLISDARRAIKDEAPLDRLRSLTPELEQLYQSLGVSGGSDGAGTSAGAGSASSQSGPGDRSSQDDDDVIDAEFTTG